MFTDDHDKNPLKQKIDNHHKHYLYRSNDIKFRQCCHRGNNEFLKFFKNNIITATEKHAEEFV